MSFDKEVSTMLSDPQFKKYIINNEHPTVSVKIFATLMAHTILKPQQLLIDNEDYYIAIDMLTNTYYICYRNLMMIDCDNYKFEGDIIATLVKYPHLYFRIYQSRNGYHVFILNKSFDYKSDESIELMINLHCDFYYTVYTYLRGWCVRLNKKRPEQEDILYKWVGDVVHGIYFPVPDHTTAQVSDIQSNSETWDFLPNERLEQLCELHIKLTTVFKNVGPCTMAAP